MTFSLGETTAMHQWELDTLIGKNMWSCHMHIDQERCVVLPHQKEYVVLPHTYRSKRICGPATYILIKKNMWSCLIHRMCVPASYILIRKNIWS